jgi:hypothetical protein
MNYKYKKTTCSQKYLDPWRHDMTYLKKSVTKETANKAGTPCFLRSTRLWNIGTREWTQNFDVESYRGELLNVKVYLSEYVKRNVRVVGCKASGIGPESCPVGGHGIRSATELSYSSDQAFLRCQVIHLLYNVGRFLQRQKRIKISIQRMHQRVDRMKWCWSSPAQ